MLGLPALMAFLAGACVSPAYYSQAVCGHLGIMARQAPITKLLESSDTSPELKQTFRQVLKIRQFARENLGLPTDRHYLNYVDLGRKYVVWNVFAAPEFSLTPKRWRLPMVGQVPYLGYFEQADAEAHAQRLTREGLDTYVGGVTAYSTLGWFADPLLNTFIHRGQVLLAALIFHELTHDLLYVKGDPAFNESLATFVAEEGLRRFAQAENNSEFMDKFKILTDRQNQVKSLIAQCRERLEQVYSLDLPERDKRLNKREAIENLREKYQKLKESWDGYDGYDRWFSGPLNNAQLASMAIYHDLVPAFRKLLAQKKGDLKNFYAECRNLAAMPAPDRTRFLEELAGGPQ